MLQHSCKADPNINAKKESAILLPLVLLQQKSEMLTNRLAFSCTKMSWILQNGFAHFRFVCIIKNKKRTEYESHYPGSGHAITAYPFSQSTQ